MLSKQTRKDTPRFTGQADQLIREHGLAANDGSPELLSTQRWPQPAARHVGRDS
jgi:hypothetical protein